MNERIKQLAEQAMQQVCTERTVKGQIERTWDPARYDQVFAELIIRECAQVCSEQRDPPNLNYKPSERFAEAVKRHFGVEK